MEIPENIAEGLRNIRSGMRLKWEPRAVLSVEGGLDVNGLKIKDPEYDPRWEVWDTTPDGLDYMVMRVQEMDGSFRHADERLLQHLNMLNPERWSSAEAMVQALIDDPTALQECGTQKDSDDLIEAAGNWAAWSETPKSGANIGFRGKRILSA